MALRLRNLPGDVLPFLNWPHKSEIRGNDYGNTDDFLYMPEIYSIRSHIFPENIAGFIVLALASVLFLWGSAKLLHTFRADHHLRPDRRLLPRPVHL